MPKIRSNTRNVIIRLVSSDAFVVVKERVWKSGLRTRSSDVVVDDNGSLNMSER
jgi:hypothetical protein